MKTKYLWLATIILLAALMISGPVFAEGEEPPAIPDTTDVTAAETPPPAPEAPAEETAAPEETPVEAPAEAETPVDEAPVVEAPAPEAAVITAATGSAVTETSAPVEAVETSALDELPEQENVIQLVDAEGESLDMASQESADLLSSGDPYWQVDGQYYSSVSDAALCHDGTELGTTCFISASPIQNAIDLIAGNAALSPSDGFVYIDYATYTGNVTIDGTPGGNIYNLKGLIGNYNQSGTLLPTIKGVLTIQNWNSFFMLQYLNVTGGVFITNSENDGQFVIDGVTAPLSITDVDSSNNNDGSGISIDNHKGNITLTRVESHRNNDSGATIDNRAGGTVTINSSKFHNNDKNGLEIISSGAVNLNTVSAEGNLESYGIKIDTNGAISLDGVKANLNLGDGINIGGGGLNFSSVSIKNSEAKNNRWPNANVDADNYGYGIHIARYSGTPAVLLENVVTNGNSNDGLFVATNGVVTAKGIKSSNNDARYGFLGYYIDEEDEYLYEKSIQDYLAEDAEYDEWMFAVTESGGKNVDISLSSPGFHPILKLGYYSETGFTIVADIDDADGDNSVALLDRFLAEGEYYIRVYSQPDDPSSSYFLSLDCPENVCEIEPGSHGLAVYNGSLLLDKGENEFTQNEFSQNAGEGLYFGNWQGKAIISNTVSEKNGASGLYSYAKSNSLTNVTAVENEGHGVELFSTAAITLNNIKANDNQFGSGIFAISRLGAAKININNSVANHNGVNGLTIEGYGAIIRNVIAQGNFSTGLDLNLNSGTGLLENIVASDNGAYGVYITHKENIVTPVTLKNMIANNNIANNNNGGGIYVESLGAVTVTGSTTDDNFRKNDPAPNTGGHGLYISTKGAVTLTGIWSSGNGGNGLMVEGVYVWNEDLTEHIGMVSPTSIMLGSLADPNFVNYFGNNGLLDNLDFGTSGIDIITEKAVTLRNFTTMDNLGDGVYVNGPNLYDANSGDFVQKHAGAVTISSSIPNWRNGADRNGDNGVEIYSSGAVSLSSLNSNENAVRSVYIDTLGAITLRDMRDWGNNERKSVELYNDEANGFMPVTITNLEVRETRDNGIDDGNGSALTVNSKGAITINGLWLENNSDMGAALTNNIDGRGNISVTNAQINNNAATGIQAFSKGAILFTNVSASWNGWKDMQNADDAHYGAYLKNYDTQLPMAVTLVDSVFEGNQGTGLWVESKGFITLRGVETRRNNVRHGYISDWQTDGKTVNEYNQPDWDGSSWVNFDEWAFDYISGDLTITLVSLDGLGGLKPVVELVDGSGSVVGSGTSTDRDSSWSLVISDGELASGSYTIRVKFDGMNDEYANGYGKYALSINDESQGNPFIPADGAVLDNKTYGTTLGVTVLPTASHTFNLFEGNNGYGLNIKTRGVVTLTNLNAHNNTYGEGLFMDNPDAIGAVTVQSTVITSPGYFGSNGGNGLLIRTRGAITLSNVEAYNNALSGADLDNALCVWDDVDGWINCAGKGAITIKSPSGRMGWFNDNRHFGIWAVSSGAMTMTNISAVNNGYDGVFLQNARGNSVLPVSVNTAGAVRSEFSNNGWNTDYPDEVPGDYYRYGLNGLSINSKGPISVMNVSASGNWKGGGGLMLNNSSSVLAKTISIMNVETSNNDWTGIWVYSKGAITLSKINASDNGFDGGIYLDNALCEWDEETLIGCDGSGGVTMTNITVENNQSLGLRVNSRGLISLTGAWINKNWDSGIWLANDTASIAGITMTNVNANGNWGGGLEAFSNGLISLKTGETSDNGDFGMHLQNNFDGTVAGITILNASAYDNNNTGISLETNGALLMTSLAAGNNAVMNRNAVEGETVQDFYNQDRGPDNWFFHAMPNTAYTFVLQADTYDEDGVGLNRTDFIPEFALIDPTTDEGWKHPLNLTGHFTCNESECVLTFFPKVDLYIDYETDLVLQVSSSNGDGFYRLSFNDNTPYDNPEQQYYVNGLYFRAGGNVTMAGKNSFHRNSLAGVYGEGKGNISLANAAAFGNGTEGVKVNNRQCYWDEDQDEEICTGIGNISMTGANVINNNGWEGLHVETNGTVSILSLEASDNGHRAEQGNTLAAIAINAYGDGKAVTLSNIVALSNRFDGLQVVSNGSASFTNVRAWLNGTDGLDVESNGIATFTSVNAMLNEGNGVNVDSKGNQVKAINSVFIFNSQDGFGYWRNPAGIGLLNTGSVSWGNDGYDWNSYTVD